MKHKIFLIASALILALFIFCGCTWPLKIDQIPELRIGSPLASIGSFTFVIKEFEDVRPYKKMISGSKGGFIYLNEDQKVSEIVTQAVANELRRNGHKILQSSESDKADVIIEGIVRQFWVDANSGFFAVTLTGAVETEINIALRQDAEKPFSKTYHGNYYYHGGGGLGILENVIKQALLDMLKEFTTDEEVLNILKKARRSE